MTDKTYDATDLKIELAALKRELRLEDEEHQRTVARINKDISRVGRELRKFEKRGK